MTIPKWHECIDPVFRVLADGRPVALQDIYARVADLVELTEVERAERLPSGRQPMYWNRIGWAVSRSKIAGLIEHPERATYALSPEGQRLAKESGSIDESTLYGYEAYRDHFDRKGDSTPQAETTVGSTTANATPIELIDGAIVDLTAALEEKVYSTLHKIESPYDFERLVTEFVARLGYGATDQIEVTPRSGDLGVDGIVRRDKLGLDRVYIQAKKYAPDNKVSAEAVRAFIGSLGLHRASAGVLITTSSFADTSRREIASTHSTNIVLIDGRELARLMVKHNIGVQTERTIEIRRLDSDFFFAASEEA